MAAERLQDIIELYRFGEGNGTYTSNCILQYTFKTVLIKGLTKGISIADVRELTSHLRALGMTKGTWERHKGTKILYKSFKI